MPAPRLYQPRSRAEVAAHLTAVEDACRADPGYLAGVAEIVGRVLREALKVTEEPAVPGESTEARARRAIMSQFATRGAA